MDICSFKDKSVLVMGLGRFGGGVDSAIFAAKAGAKVVVTDMADEDTLSDALEKLSPYDITYHLGNHLGDDFDGTSDTDIVIVNPAVRPDNKFVRLAENAGITVTSQIELFFEMCPAKIVGITGANGKSTTTAITAHILEGAVKPARKLWLSGNIGNRPLLDILDQVGSDDIVVLEISSFQAEQLGRSKKAPHISVITNLTPNHLDRHGTFEEYCKAKKAIFEFQQIGGDEAAVSIFNAEDPVTNGWFEKYSAESGRISHAYKASDVGAELAGVFRLAGEMNLSNLAAALAVADHFEIDKDRLLKAVSTFKSLPNRLELIAEYDGVKWYDDSIATTPDSAVAALKAFNQPKIIIAGGYDKRLGFDEFGKVIAEKAKAAILIGQTADAISSAIHDAGKRNVHVEIVGSMEDAVIRASKLSKPGDVVLMSPACASYDMFDNYKQRGEVFAEAVRRRAAGNVRCEVQRRF
ncbi:MAG: UDP-N-acetylmuramoyl-L-alanine--D-glutamate ligase [Planctomycetes bacterium]|nr:UDP-N-acetylmuramoyl-L-alanine--D-glutamate ligase [Planctomycetota bacterium]